jgi:hypothetical protein
MCFCLRTRRSTALLSPPVDTFQDGTKQRKGNTPGWETTQHHNARKKNSATPNYCKQTNKYSHTHTQHFPSQLLQQTTTKKNATQQHTPWHNQQQKYLPSNRPLQRTS